MLDRLAPFLFVFLWSTGWLVAGISAQYADPLTFLSVRFGLAFLLLLPILLLLRLPWPKEPAEIGHGLATGILIHGAYLGAVWWAVGQGVPAGVSALIAALQPLMTAAFGPMLIGERLTVTQICGTLIAVLGVALVNRR